MRTRLAICVALVAALAVTGTAAAAGPAPTIQSINTSKFPEVSVNVKAATATAGRSDCGGDRERTARDRRQPEYERQRAGHRAAHDTSRSMDGKPLADANAAANGFIFSAVTRRGDGGVRIRRHSVCERSVPVRPHRRVTCNQSARDRGQAGHRAVCRRRPGRERPGQAGAGQARDRAHDRWSRRPTTTPPWPRPRRLPRRPTRPSMRSRHRPTRPHWHR